MSDVPPFQLGEPRYSQATFEGRLRHFCSVIDPRTLLTTKAELERSIQLLDDFKNGRRDPSVTDAQLWQAQKIKQAIIHPDTGEKILPPFRMSGFVPFGTPIVVGLLLPNLTLPQTVFWQWLNQSHNACVNYSNRNATKPTPTSRFLLGYFGAVTSAAGIAVGLTIFLRRLHGLAPATRALIQRFVPLPAVATASVSNVVLMRNSELAEGIDVFDSNKQVVGTSKAAAKKALKETAMTRAVLPCPILLLPPLVMTFLEKTRWMIRNPRLQLPVQALVTTAAFGGALPVTIALFPQISSVNVADLEPELRAKTNEEVLFYNKGL